MEPRSTCCNAPVRLGSSDEGTNWHECTKCGKPCDTGKRQPLTVQKYLRTVRRLQRKNRHEGYRFTGIADLLCQHGRSFKPAPLPEGIRRGAQNQCFKNAADLAVNDSRFIYCEGCALGLIPVDHAWCVTKEGLVVDVTWESGIEYFGVPIKTSFLRRRLVERGIYGVLDDWQNRWPVLKLAPETWLQQL